MMHSLSTSLRSFYVIFCSKIKLLNLFCLVTALFLAGCSHSHSPETFPKPDYSYLPSLYFNVEYLHTLNQAPVTERNLAEQSPSPPASTLTLMAQQRLKTTGSTGTASFAITQATITKQAHDIFAGTFSIKLTVDDPTQQHHGQITATVHQQRSFSSRLSQQQNLYTLNQSMMDDMNVEIEYQIRKHLSDWLTDATGTPLSGQINSQDLNTTQQSSDSSAVSPTSPPSQRINHAQPNTGSGNTSHTTQAEKLYSPQ